MNNIEFSNIQRGLTKSLESSYLNVIIHDSREDPANSYDAPDLLLYLYLFSKHQANFGLFKDPEFLMLFQAILQKEALLPNGLKLLSSICSNYEHALIIYTSHSELLSKLEELSFSGNDLVSSVAATTAEKSLINANDTSPGMFVLHYLHIVSDIMQFYQLIIHTQQFCYYFFISRHIIVTCLSFYFLELSTNDEIFHVIRKLSVTFKSLY